jgi:hypothetical protein
MNTFRPTTTELGLGLSSFNIIVNFHINLTANMKSVAPDCALGRLRYAKCVTQIALRRQRYADCVTQTALRRLRYADSATQIALRRQRYADCVTQIAFAIDVTAAMQRG